MTRTIKAKYGVEFTDAAGKRVTQWYDKKWCADECLKVFSRHERSRPRGAIAVTR